MKKTNFELFVDLIRALAWPALAAIFLASFWSPLHRIADLVPSLIGRSDTITIAGLSLKLTPSLKSKAKPDVQRALAKVSHASIEQILGLGDTTSWDKDSIAFGKSQSKELIDAGLVEEVSAIDLEKMNLKSGSQEAYAVRTTDLGKRTQSFLRTVVIEVVQEIASGAVTESK